MGGIAGQLLEAGHDVVALARTPGSASDLAAAGTEVVEGDITDPETVRDPMDGVDGAFHVAGCTVWASTTRLRASGSTSTGRAT